jgi:diguanylate cyclase (GGDEF)-like protein
MNIYSILPLLATIAYVPLFIILLTSRTWKKQHWLLLAYLFAASVWSLTAFLVRSDFFSDYKLLFLKVALCGLPLTAGFLLYFIDFHTHRPLGRSIYMLFGLLAVFVLLDIIGYIPTSITFTDGGIALSFGWWFYLLSAFFLIYPVIFIPVLVRKYRRLTSPAERNTHAYFIITIALLTIGALAGLSPIGEKFPVSHFANLLNAIIVTRVVIKGELMSVSLLARRGLVFAGLTTIATAIYLVLYAVVRLFLEVNPKPGVLALAVIGAILVGITFLRLRNSIEKKIDRLFLSKRYNYREELSGFIRNKISGVFSLGELGEGLLPPLIKALQCKRAYLLLPESVSGDFLTEFCEPDIEERQLIRIRYDSPIVEWLNHHNKFLTTENIDIFPQFKSLWGKEKHEIRQAAIELVFPIISRDNLIGILALSKKESGKYTLDDVNLVQSIASQIAISLEKEYLQAELRKREQELALINRLAGVMTSSLKIRDIYDTFISGLKEVIDVEYAFINLIDGDELYCTASYGRNSAGKAEGRKTILAGTATEWVANNRKSLVEPDLQLNKLFPTYEVIDVTDIRSVVYLPLLNKGEGIGSLTIASSQPKAYSQAQIHLLERLASQISTSVVNSLLYEKAEQRARIDELTGLFNRRHFDEVLKREIHRHSRYGSTLSLAFIDLDGFKKYNDTRGHLEGDELLSKTGTLIKETIRAIDLAFRYGGDEFAIIMAHTSADDAYVAADRVRTSITNAMKAMQVGVTLSMGLACWPHDGLAQDDVVNAADQALYYAKRTGGNRTCVVSQILPSQAGQADLSPAAEKETLNTIYALAATIEARDPYTYGHSRKVRTYAIALAESLGLLPETVAIISHAALLHDIGKIGILDEILNKPGKLDLNEMKLIKNHPQLSRNIVGHVPSLTPCLPAILHHHEHWDGNGYPGGLKGEAIPIEARILSIADAFDAMTSLRPYRAPFSYKEAVEELKRCAGTQFDPELVQKFLPIALATTPEEMELVSHADSD